MKDTYIKVDNTLITAKYDYTLIETKLLYITFGIIRYEKHKQPTHTINYKQLEKYCGTEINYTTLKEAARAIMSKTFEIETEKNGKKTWEIFNLWSVFKYNENEATISITVNERAIQPLYELNEKYGLINLTAFVNIKSNYTQRIYTLCCKNHKLKTIHSIEITKLREIIGTGKKYKDFKKFNQVILQNAKTEINSTENIEFTIDYEFTKNTNREITHITIITKPKNNQKTIPKTIKEHYTVFEEIKSENTQTNNKNHELYKYVLQETNDKILSEFITQNKFIGELKGIIKTFHENTLNKGAVIRKAMLFDEHRIKEYEKFKKSIKEKKTS